MYLPTAIIIQIFCPFSDWILCLIVGFREFFIYSGCVTHKYFLLVNEKNLVYFFHLFNSSFTNQSSYFWWKSIYPFFPLWVLIFILRLRRLLLDLGVCSTYKNSWIYTVLICAHSWIYAILKSKYTQWDITQP